MSSTLSPPSSSLVQSSTSSSLSLSTTASLVSSTASALPAHSSGNDLSRGVWAGIAIGCSIGELIIGLLAAMLFLRRRYATTRTSTEPELLETPSNNMSLDSRPCSVSPAAEPVPSIAPTVSDLDQFLAIPVSDRDLASELRSLGYLIQQHVEDNYHLSAVTQSTSSLSQALTDLGLNDIGKAIPQPVQLAEMAVNPKTRYVALQHAIARVIFDSISVKSTGKVSMLPPSVSSLTQSMPPCEKHIGNPDAVSLALIRWRQLSAFLLNPRRSDRGPVVAEDSELKPRAEDLVMALNKFLGAFVGDKSRAYQENHLQAVVLECAKFGYVIFSQPAEFAWKFEAEAEKEIVVCPGLEKVTDGHNVRFTPESVAAPEIHKI